MQCSFREAPAAAGRDEHQSVAFSLNYVKPITGESRRGAQGGFTPVDYSRHTSHIDPALLAGPDVPHPAIASAYAYGSPYEAAQIASLQATLEPETTGGVLVGAVLKDLHYSEDFTYQYPSHHQSSSSSSVIYNTNIGLEELRGGSDSVGVVSYAERGGGTISDYDGFAMQYSENNNSSSHNPLKFQFTQSYDESSSNGAAVPPPPPFERNTRGPWLQESGSNVNNTTSTPDASKKLRTTSIHAPSHTLTVNVKTKVRGQRLSTRGSADMGCPFADAASPPTTVSDTLDHVAVAPHEQQRQPLSYQTHPALPLLDRSGNLPNVDTNTSVATVALPRPGAVQAPVTATQPPHHQQGHYASPYGGDAAGLEDSGGGVLQQLPFMRGPCLDRVGTSDLPTFYMPNLSGALAQQLPPFHALPFDTSVLGTGHAGGYGAAQPPQSQPFHGHLSPAPAHHQQSPYAILYPTNVSGVVYANPQLALFAGAAPAAPGSTSAFVDAHYNVFAQPPPPTQHSQPLCTSRAAYGGVSPPVTQLGAVTVPSHVVPPSSIPAGPVGDHAHYQITGAAQRHCSSAAAAAVLSQRIAQYQDADWKKIGRGPASEAVGGAKGQRQQPHHQQPQHDGSRQPQPQRKLEFPHPETECGQDKILQSDRTKPIRTFVLVKGKLEGHRYATSMAESELPIGTRVLVDGDRGEDIGVVAGFVSIPKMIIDCAHLDHLRKVTDQRRARNQLRAAQKQQQSQQEGDGSGATTPLCQDDDAAPATKVAEEEEVAEQLLAWDAQVADSMEGRRSQLASIVYRYKNWPWIITRATADDERRLLRQREEEIKALQLSEEIVRRCIDNDLQQKIARYGADETRRAGANGAASRSSPDASSENCTASSGRTISPYVAKEVKLVDCELQLNRQKLTLYMSRPSQDIFVDFRRMQRKLFRVFRCRIWLAYVDELSDDADAPENQIII